MPNGLAVAAVMTALAGGSGASPLPARYQIALPARLEVDQGKSAALSLTIAPDPGYSISRTGPLLLSLFAEPADGLELPRGRYQRNHAADPLADAPRFDLALRGARAGRYQLRIEILFWLCRGRVCRPIRATRTAAIEVRQTQAARPRKLNASSTRL